MRLGVAAGAGEAPCRIEQPIDERESEPGAGPGAVAGSVGPGWVPFGAVEERDIVGARVAVGVQKRACDEEVTSRRWSGR